MEWYTSDEIAEKLEVNKSTLHWYVYNYPNLKKEPFTKREKTGGRNDSRLFSSEFVKWYNKTKKRKDGITAEVIPQDELDKILFYLFKKKWTVKAVALYFAKRVVDIEKIFKKNQNNTKKVF